MDGAAQAVALTIFPGLAGVRHFLAAGQQYESAQGETQSAPGVTQILVNGQQTWPVPHAVALVAQLVAVGVKHFFASGQQYSLDLQTAGLGAGGAGGGLGLLPPQSSSTSPGRRFLALQLIPIGGKPPSVIFAVLCAVAMPSHVSPLTTVYHSHSFGG